MFGVNWVDLIIVVLLVLAVIEGMRIGLLSQLLSIAGFFAGLFLAGWLFPYVIRFDNPTLRTIVNATLVLLFALYTAVLGFDIAQKVHWSFRLGKLTGKPRLKRLENILGVVPGVVACLVVVWILGVTIGRLPLVGLSNSVSDAATVQLLTNNLPPSPAVFAVFNRKINPNAQPAVLAQSKPQPDFNYNAADVEQAVVVAKESVVRITSFSCGGIVGGSGFAVAPGLIATAAHVVAGSKRPIIKYRDISYEAKPVYFDAIFDLAVLQVAKLPTPALNLAKGDVPLDTTVAVIGYPDGNYGAAPGIIRDTRAIAVRSIYDQGSLSRGVYDVQTSALHGNSGGPVVLKNGQVAGVLFSTAPDVNNVAYALKPVYLADALKAVQKTSTRVSTGACLVQ